MTRWVTRLIIANAAVFLLTSASPAITEKLMFVPVLVLSRPWTLVTYMFLHAGFGHIFFNMLGLFFFGPRLELELGSSRFLWLYFLSGIMGALLSLFISPHAAIVGASGAVYGVMMGFAYFWPVEPIYIYGIFPIQARWLVVIMTGLSLFGGFGGAADGTAHFAHLGGFLGGYLYLRFSGGRIAQATPIAAVPVPSAADLSRWRGISRDGLHEVNRDELDRILDKISASGVQSLSPKEREFLDRFSNQ
jgi:membrane associated rhomboid family serine protease